MTINVSNVDVTVDTFSVMVSRVNQLADAMSNHTVTLDTSASGNSSSGNGFISGIFGANTIAVGTNIRGGSVNQSANLNVTSNTVFESNVVFGDVVTFNSAISLANGISVNSAANFSNTISITGNATLSNSVIILGNTTLSNTLSVTGNSIFANTLSVIGNVNLSNTLSIIGNTSLSNTLTVAGNTNLSNTLSVTGITTLSNALNVTGITTLSNTLNVTRAATLSNTLNVTGSATLSNTLSVTGATTLSDTLAVTKAVTLSNTLNVTGASTFSNTVTVNNLIVTGNTNIDTKTLFVDSTNDRIGIGNTSPDARLTVTGAANVSGNVAIGGDLNVTGNTVFDDKVTFLTDIEMYNGRVISPVLIQTLDSNAALKITQSGTGHALYVEDSTSPDPTPTVITNNGVFISGSNSQLTIASIAKIQAISTDLGSHYLAAGYANSPNHGARITFYKSRSVNTELYSAVVNGDQIGRLDFFADDGGQPIEACRIMVMNNGSPGPNSMPTSMYFYVTGEGSNSAVTGGPKLAIFANGNIGIGTVSSVNAKLTLQGTANVSGNVSLAENLTVVGNSNFTGNIILTGNAALSNTLVVTGNTRLANTLTVTGNATFANVVTINGSATINNLTVTGNTNLDTGTLFIDATNDRIGIGNTTPDAKLTVTGTANVSGNVSLAENLIVIGNSSFTGNVILTGNAALSNTLVVTGNTRLANTLTVTGNTRLANTLVVTGNVSLSNTLTVTGNTTLSGPVTLSINNSEPALKITQSGSGHTLYIEDSTSPDATPTVITTTGAIVSGANSAPSSPLNARISSINDTGSGYLVANYANLSNQPARISFYKTLSVNTDISNVYSPVLNNYALGSLFFYGDDGGQPIEAARITVLTNGIPGPNSMPTALHFYTTNDGSNSALAAGPKLSIMANGNVGVGAGTPTEKLYVNGNLRVTGNSNISGELYVSSNTNIDGGTFSVDTVLNTVGVGTATPNTKLSVSGPIALYPPTKVITAAYTVTTNDSSLIIDTIANCNLVMPAAATYPGRVLYIKNIAAMAVNSTSASIKPIGSNASANSILTNTAGKFAMLQSDGADWVIMMSN